MVTCHFTCHIFCHFVMQLENCHMTLSKSLDKCNLMRTTCENVTYKLTLDTFHLWSATWSMPHATCNTKKVTSNKKWVTSNTKWVTCNTKYVTFNMGCVTCCMKHVTCYITQSHYESHGMYEMSSAKIAPLFNITNSKTWHRKKKNQRENVPTYGTISSCSF